MEEGKRHLTEGRLSAHAGYGGDVAGVLSKGRSCSYWIPRHNGGKWAGIIVKYLNTPYSNVGTFECQQEELVIP